MKPLVAPAALLVCVGLLSPGCVSTRTKAAAKVKDAGERSVANCTYLGDVSGSSGASVLGMASDVSVENARNDGAEKAAAMGATHVVWGPFQSGQKTTIQGRAYACPEGTK